MCLLGGRIPLLATLVYIPGVKAKNCTRSREISKHLTWEQRDVSVVSSAQGGLEGHEQIRREANRGTLHHPINTQFSLQLFLTSRALLKFSHCSKYHIA